MLNVLFSLHLICYLITINQLWKFERCLVFPKCLRPFHVRNLFRVSFCVDLLSDAVPESLKNMLLVMDTAGIFQSVERQNQHSASLWELTWDKLETFLPTLMEDLFGDRQRGMSIQNVEERPRVDDRKPSAGNVDSKPAANVAPTNPEKPTSTVEESAKTVEEENHSVDAHHVQPVLTVDTTNTSFNDSNVENLPLSPINPPIASPSSFYAEPTNAAKAPPQIQPPTFFGDPSTAPRHPARPTSHVPPPVPTIFSLPSRPTIAPMPPPPPGNY